MDEPYFLPIGDEVSVFQAAFECRLPVLLKGPTGCGKTRFVEYMAHTVGTTDGAPVSGNLITVACHEDLTGSDFRQPHRFDLERCARRVEPRDTSLVHDVTSSQ